MALSIAASSATTMVQQGGTTSVQPRATLPNPFDLNDDQILDIVYLAHLNDDETCDTNSLYNLVSNIVLRSQSPISATGFKPEFSTLKLISCQMISTREAAHCVHQTTMWILQHLKCYSWDAKALITIASLSLEYGSFVHLSQFQTNDVLGNSLKQLNHVQNRKVSADVIELVTYLVQVFLHIKEWARYSADGYDPEDVPSLTEAFQAILLVVYWTIAATVASTGNLVGVSSYKLSEYRVRLSIAVKKLTTYLAECNEQIGNVQDYVDIRRVIEKPKDIVDLLKALIYPRKATQNANPKIFEGTNLVREGIEVFKQKHVLLFISGLYSVDDEISLLNSIRDRLQEDPKEAKNFNKEDFKILWIPIVEGRKEQFKSLKSNVRFYVVEYFFELPGLKIVKEKLKYENQPIVPLFTPKGTIMNENALDVIFEWGIEAFPFRKSDGADLTLKWKWLWDLLFKATPGLQVKKDRYIFIYGGNNSTWIQNFAQELSQIKRNETIQRADVIIDYYQLGKGEANNSVPSFWIGVERKKQNKKHQESVDCEIQKIVKYLFCLKRDPQGWAILSKGHNIKHLCHGQAVYQTLNEFQNWKGKVLEKEGFDIAFKEYYEAKKKEISATQPCEFINLDNYGTSSVIATITCPNPSCGRVMEVSSVNYKCCHRDDGLNC
ncbi:SIEVE ELEMENT OCCLUSION B protein [Spatholobus suberectus]|nr:SIEVE ELEMENT OCCLUSION B protein [Spatholobus suberectus]